jgi:hypothetical protein
MRRSFGIALLLAAAAGAACGGDSQQQALFNERQSICNGIISKGETTAQVAGFYTVVPTTVDCRPPTSSDPTRPPFVHQPSDTCVYSQPVCERIWQFDTNGSECGPNGCCYRCKVRSAATPTDDLTQTLVAGTTTTTATDTPACNVEFNSQQPCIGPVIF